MKRSIYSLWRLRRPDWCRSEQIIILCNNGNRVILWVCDVFKQRWHLTLSRILMRKEKINEKAFSIIQTDIYHFIWVIFVIARLASVHQIQTKQVNVWMHINFENRNSWVQCMPFIAYPISDNCDNNND